MLNPLKLYSLLLRLYPATFRERHEQAIEQQFRDEYRDAAGVSSRFTLWLRAVCDLAVSIPVELANEIAHDVRYALRLYGKRPAPAFLAITALAFSIGAATGLFSVLNAVLLRSLPFLDPENIVEFRNAPFTAGMGRSAFDQWRIQNPYLQDAATFSTSDMNLAGTNGAVRVRVTESSANFHRLLGMTPIAGRTFAADDDKPGHTNLAVISYSLWQQRFGGDSAVIGVSIQLNGVPLTIIGVAPPGFDYPISTSIWIPTVFDFERVPKRGAFLFQTIGRLNGAVTLQQARALFDSEVQRTAPAALRADESNRPRLVAVREELAGPIGKAVWVFAGMMLFVLLTACANVAHLLLSRIVERRDELTMRTALGASRGRLLQQLTTEATVLTLAGALLGIVVAIYTAQIVSTVAPPVLATQQYTLLDWRVASFAVVLAATTSLVFGVLPLLVSREPHTPTQVVRTQQGSRGSATARVRFTLLTLQACVTLVLLSITITMGRTFLNLLNTDLGFRTDSAVTMTVSLQGTKYRSGAAQWRYYNEVLERLRQVPGVEHAGAVSYVPLADNVYMANAFKLDSGRTIDRVVTNAATEGYFRAVGTKIVAGRDFGPALSPGLEPMVIVNEAFVNASGAAEHLTGRRLIAPWTKTPYLIAGIVETSRSAGPAHPGVPMIYWPVEEEPSQNLTFVARVKGDASAYLTKCRDAVRSIDGSVPVYQVETLEQRRAAVLARPRFLATATLLLAIVALFLATVGTFGASAQAIAGRRSEIGIRMALGGSQERIQWMLIRQSLVPTAIGVAMGITVVLASSRYMEHLEENVPALGGWTYAAAASVLTLSALIAAWRATGRLFAIHPADVVRAQ